MKHCAQQQRMWLVCVCVCVWQVPFGSSPDQEGAEEDEGDEVAVREVRPAASLVVRRRGEGRDGGVRLTLPTRQAGEHDLLPRLPGGAPGGLKHTHTHTHTHTPRWRQIKSRFLEVERELDKIESAEARGFLFAHLKRSMSALKKVLKLLCWLMWLSSFSLMFPNTCSKQVFISTDVKYMTYI